MKLFSRLGEKLTFLRGDGGYNVGLIGSGDLFDSGFF
jgi:hypothetical protein